MENSIFFENSCIGGAGGAASGTRTAGGAGGAAVGGGVSTGGGTAMIRNCTLATNTLVAGPAGGDAG